MVTHDINVLRRVTCQSLANHLPDLASAEQRLADAKHWLGERRGLGEI